METMMTRDAAIALLQERAEDHDWDEGEIEEVFAALYGRQPDNQDRIDNVLSLCYAHPDAEEALRPHD